MVCSKRLDSRRRQQSVQCIHRVECQFVAHHGKRRQVRKSADYREVFRYPWRLPRGQKTFSLYNDLAERLRGCPAKSRRSDHSVVFDGVNQPGHFSKKSALELCGYVCLSDFFAQIVELASHNLQLLVFDLELGERAVEVIRSNAEERQIIVA